MGEDIGTGSEHGAQQRKLSLSHSISMLPHIRCITVSDDLIRFEQHFIPDWLRTAAHAFFSS
jgi:hypothetical protein